MRKNLLMALLCLAVACVFAASAFAEKEKVSYILHGWDPDKKELTTTNPSVECTMLTENDGTLRDGWYAAKGTLTFSSQLYCNGDVHLILMDGCKVKAEQGIYTVGNCTLKIYAQSEGAKTGSLEAVGTSIYPAIGGGDSRSIAPVEIHGGLVSASGTGLSAAIGGGEASPGQVTIYGGIVSASINKMVVTVRRSVAAKDTMTAR